MKHYLKLEIFCLLAGTLAISCKNCNKNGANKPIDDKIDIEMVFVEGGTFTMGATSEQGNYYHSNECPPHSVTLSSYHISKYEITQAQYQVIMGNNPSKFKGDSLPVESVSWTQAKAFCDSLSKKTGKKYALPTEAQWEFAARGGVKSKGYKHSGSNAIDSVAWYGNNSDDRTHAVGTKVPNELGIYDMSGNVWEWCADWYDDDYGYGSCDADTNPTGPTTGSHRVIRGGSWLYYALSCRVSTRLDGDPDGRSNNLGFRVVCLP